MEDKAKRVDDFALILWLKNHFALSVDVLNAESCPVCIRSGSSRIRPDGTRRDTRCGASMKAGAKECEDEGPPDDD